MSEHDCHTNVVKLFCVYKVNMTLKNKKHNCEFNLQKTDFFILTRNQVMLKGNS